VKIATLLGPKYLHFIIKEMKDTLTKGYQVRHEIGILMLYIVSTGSCTKLQHTYIIEWS